MPLHPEAVLQTLLFFLLEDRIWICRPNWPDTHLPASASRVLVTGKCHHTPRHTQHCYVALWNFLPGVYHELLLSDYIVAHCCPVSILTRMWVSGTRILPIMSSTLYSSWKKSEGALRFLTYYSGTIHVTTHFSHRSFGSWAGRLCLALILSRLQACSKPSHSPHIETYHSTDKVRILKLCNMPLLVLFWMSVKWEELLVRFRNVVKGTKGERNLEIMHSKPSFMDASETQRKKITSQTSERRTMSIQTRLQTPSSVSTAKWTELSLGVSPSPIGGSCWFPSCVLAMDSPQVASVLTLQCQKFERALTSNVLACDFCAFSPKPSVLLIISCCHNHGEGLL